MDGGRPMRGILVLAVLTTKSSYSQNVELAGADADDVPTPFSGGLAKNFGDIIKTHRDPFRGLC